MFAETYAKCYELLNREKNYKKEIEFVWEWGHRPKRILDLGCGVAHYWKYYPTGTELFGIEKSEDMRNVSEFKDRIFCYDITRIDPFFVSKQFDLVTALFDVLGYVGRQDWWKYLPIAPGGYFIFDIWDKEKVAKEGFKISIRIIQDVIRIINPIYQDENKVRFEITLTSSSLSLKEIHEMYLYDSDEIAEFAGDDFEVVDLKKTQRWQTWFKLKKR